MVKEQKRKLEEKKLVKIIKIIGEKKISLKIKIGKKRIIAASIRSLIRV